MDRLLTLTQLLLKGSPPNEAIGSTGRRQRIRSKVGRIVAYTLIALYFLFLVVLFSRATLSNLIAVGAAQSFPPMILIPTGILVIFFGFFYVVSAYYHATDIESLLVLPVRPRDIVAAKFVQIYLYELLIAGIFALPALSTYGIMTQQPVFWWPLMLLIVLSLPIVPLAMITVVTMLMMRFTPFARDKDRFAMITNLFFFALMLVVLYFSMRSGSSAGEQMAKDGEAVIFFGIDEATMMRLAQLSWLFPGMRFASDALTSSGLLSGLLPLLAFLGVGLVALVIAYFAADLLYARAIVSIRQHRARRRALSGGEIARATRSQGTIRTLIQKDLRTIVRSPVFLLNNLLSSMIMPLMFIVMPFVIMSGEDLAMARAFIGSYTGFEPDLRAYIGFVFAGATALGLFFNSGNSIATTALSREGQALWMMKILPVPYIQQVAAKLLLAFAISGLPTVIFTVVGVVLFQLPPLFAVIIPILALLGTAIATVYNFLFDLFSPKLEWQNETQAVKNNLNVLWGSLLSFVLSGLVIGVQLLMMRFLPEAGLWSALIVQFALAALLFGIGLVLLGRLVPRRMRAIEV